MGFNISINNFIRGGRYMPAIVDKLRVDDQVLYPVTLADAVYELKTGKSITERLSDIDTEMAELKKSVSDGKTLIATAITGHDVATDPTDSFETMAANIAAIFTGAGTAEVDDVVEGETFVNATKQILTGTMKDIAAIDTAVSINMSSNVMYVRMNPGAHRLVASSGYPEVKVDGSLLGTAAGGQVLSGYTATSKNGINFPGSIASMAGGSKTPSTSTVTVACSGKYMTSDITIPAFTLPAANVIKKGTKVTIYGKSVTGTFEGYVATATDLYYKGTNNASFTLNSNMSFETSAIKCTGIYNGILTGGKAYNFTAYTKIQLQFKVTSAPISYGENSGKNYALLYLTNPTTKDKYRSDWFEVKVNTVQTITISGLNIPSTFKPKVELNILAYTGSASEGRNWGNGKYSGYIYRVNIA